MDALVVPPRPPAPVIQIDDLRQALEIATDPVEIKDINARLDAFEQYMHDCGLYSIEDMRPINETRMLARWKLGRALKEVQRAVHPGKGKVALTSLTSLLMKLSLTRPTALEAQRIGALPKEALSKVFAKWCERGELLSYSDLIQIAKPHWYKEKRGENQSRIVTSAAKLAAPDKLGPFALIYADPPWTFETHTPELTHRMPDDHYPVMSDEEIINAKFHGQSIGELAQDDCALFMWCTSSNLVRALAVMDGWGFEYLTQAVWDKRQIGLGLIFRNQHEVLLYGARGKPPKPINLVSSVFSVKRGRHSAKPKEVRAALERMYPKFGAENRIEMFCRGQVSGWTCVGHEAGRKSAA